MVTTAFKIINKKINLKLVNKKLFNYVVALNLTLYSTGCTNQIIIGENNQQNNKMQLEEKLKAESEEQEKATSIDIIIKGYILFPAERIELYSNWLKSYPKDLIVLRSLLDTYLDINEKSQAMKIEKRILAIMPKEYDDFIWLSKYYCAQKNFLLAQKNYEEAILFDKGLYKDSRKLRARIENSECGKISFKE